MSKRCITILMMPKNNGLSEAHKRCLNEKVTLETFEWIDYKSIRRNFQMLREILRIIWRVKPDILHVQSNGFRLFFWVALFKPFRTKIVNTIHDPEKHSGDALSLAVDDSLVEYTMRFFTKKYIVHGTRLIDELARAYKISRNRIVSIPHGHFGIYKNFQQEEATETTFVVLFFGRIWPYKGLTYFIEAANLVHAQSDKIKFCIAGTGESLDKYVSQIHRKDLFQILNRKIPIQEVGMLFQKASVVVLPYLDATQSGVIPIAYAYSKPVIATAVGGLPDVVVEGQTGFLTDVKSSQQIADKILYLYSHPAEKVQMENNAFDFAHTQLSWDRISEMTYSIYTSL